MRKLFWIAAALPLLGASAAHARIISRSAEISVGREAASQVERAYTVDTDPAAVARVRQIGRRLTGAAKDVEFPFEFHVVENPTVNAFALPGGYIYVFRGLLQLLPNDDALAFVLAHEISHVTRRHAVRQFEKNALLSAGITAVLAGTGAGGGVAAGAEVARTIASLSFTRHDEQEADENGMELFVRSGYNPRAAAEAMEVLKRAGGSGKSIPALLRSHPLPDQRIRKLNELAEQHQAQAAEARKTAPVPPPPPAVPPRRIAGLASLEVEPCAWQPLVTGARWTYRVQGEAQQITMTTRVLEALAGEPSGVYRVEYDLGRGIRSLRWVAPAGDRLVTRAETPDDSTPWRPEAVFAPGAALALGEGALRFAGTEKVSVPAGEWEAARVERLDPAGAVLSTAWYVRGVGLVKQRSAAGTQELVSYRIPENRPG